MSKKNLKSASVNTGTYFIYNNFIKNIKMIHHTFSSSLSEIKNLIMGI